MADMKKGIDLTTVCQKAPSTGSEVYMAPDFDVHPTSGLTLTTISFAYRSFQEETKTSLP
eukprot:scaffold1959_cov162-Amphora_coffeaeformis.AAC.2